MKVAIIGTTANSIVGFRKELILSLVSQGHDVFAFAADYSKESKSQVRQFGATPVDYFLERAGLNPLRDIKDTILLSRVLKNIRPDVVFSYFAKPVVYGTLAAKLAGVERRVGMLEGLGYAFTDHPCSRPMKASIVKWLQVQLYRLSFHFLDRIIFLNHDDPVDLISRHSLRVRQVSVLGGIGLDLSEYPYAPPKTEPIRFVFVGRLLAEKGIHEFVSAAKVVKKIIPDAEFVVLGRLDEVNPGGLSRFELEALIKSGTVIYPGHVDNVAEWISASSVFVLPSYREGFPRSTQEAMAIGRAIITTDAPGCRETVEDGVNGYIVRRWSVDDLAEKMCFLARNPELIVAFGEASYKLALERFDGREVSDRLAELIFK